MVMEVIQKQDSLLERFIKLYHDNANVLLNNDTADEKLLRERAFNIFQDKGFPHDGLEAWRNTDLEDALVHPYMLTIGGEARKTDVDELFRCEVPHFDTYLLTLLNGGYVYSNEPLRKFDNGVIAGSLASARKEFPDLVAMHYGKYADIEQNSLVALNTAVSRDGIFIYVPDNVEVDDTMQIVNIVSKEEDMFLNIRNLVVVGKSSKLRLVYCDESVEHRKTFINAVTEVYLDGNAELDHYKMQNKDDSSVLINSTFIHQQADSRLTTNNLSLNGGIIRNDSHVRFNGRGCSADVYGLYLMDRNQHIDNHVFIDHAFPDCYSNEMFKGILDDQASGVFNGHVLVQQDAQRTNAHQSNKNILLTDKATIDARPFLEIYADDVKCSHGATVGQLDNNAMFYLRSRGIGEYNARMLLMYAFAAEIVNKISIEALRERLDDMVKKRLRGELSICDQCVLRCKHQEKSISFPIDLSKI